MSGPSGRPLVSCLMPTRDRRRFVPLAIELFLRQDYPERELLILDDGDDPVADLVPPDPRIRYERLPRHLVLGGKRNHGCRLAQGELVAHWDDDDWSAPWRLSYQVEALLGSGVDVCGLRELYFLDPQAGRAWRYTYPPRGLRPWVAGGTMCYTKAYWRRHRFPEVGAGEDTRFLWSGRPRVLALEDSRFYVAMIHARNTSPKRPRGSRWQPVDARTVAGLVGDDLPGYGQTLDTGPTRQHVTVSVPYYGCKRYIRQAVQSILAQSHRDLTVVVVNDGDPDPPWEPLADLDDPRLVRFDLDRNRGRYFADAVVLAATTSPLFAPHDADDWSEPDRIASLLRRLRETHAVGAFSAYLRHPAGGTPRHVRVNQVHDPLGERLTDRAYHIGLYDTAALRAIGGYYAGFRVGFDSLLVNLLQMTGPLAFLDRPLYHSRARPGSLTSARDTGMRSAHRRTVRVALSQLYTQARRHHRAYLAGEIGREELQYRIRGLVSGAVPEDDRRAVEEAAARLAPRLREAEAAATDWRDAVQTPAPPPSPTGAPGPAHPPGRGVRAVLTDPTLWRGGWSLEPTTAAELAARLAQRRPARILEVGSGASTVLLAAHAAATGAQVVTLEHDPRFAAKTTDLLRRAGLGRHVRLVTTPLEPLACADGRTHPWYATTLTGPIDFVLIDGPPGRFGREAALFAIAGELAADWEAWLDDGYRDGERGCVDLWRRHLGIEARLEPVGRGLWVLRPTGVAPDPPAPPPQGLAVALLTGASPDLLRGTVASIERADPRLLPDAPVVALHNGTDRDTEEALDAYPWIDVRLRPPGRPLPVGEAVSLLMAEAAKLDGADVVLALQDGWQAATSDAGWLERATGILRSHPDLGQVRLRHAGEQVLSHHMVTRRPIQWRERGGWWYSPSAHFTFNPNLVRVRDLRRIFPAGSERAAQRRFHQHGLATAQLLPGVFHRADASDSPHPPSAAATTRAASSLVLFWSAFDIHRLNPARRTSRWIEHRFRHWLSFTLPSILQQDHDELLYWLVCDPAARRLTEPLQACIRDARVRLVYADACPELLGRLPKRDRYLVTRIDSDDLYHPSVASTLARQPTSAEFFQFNNGYACNLDTGELRRWDSNSSPFYCHVYGQELRSLAAWSEPNHTTVRQRAAVLGPGQFLVALHQQNTSSSIRLGGSRLTGRAAASALGSFGLGRELTLPSLLARARGQAAWDTRSRQLRDELGPRYRRWVEELPDEAPSISLEVATFFGFLCEAVAARRILDLGAGFGSVVARAYASAHPSVVCHTVDTSPAALDRTRRFLRASGLPSGGLFRWSAFRGRAEPGYDLVLHDLGDPHAQAETLPAALEAVLPTGVVLLDDHHQPEYAARVSSTLARYCADTFPEVEAITRDQLGRSALLLARVIGPLDA
jgi:glycosyltransferase involved in cell wall biosynthesis/predicted O-methyltransferase YrrM